MRFHLLTAALEMMRQPAVRPQSVSPPLHASHAQRTTPRVIPRNSTRFFEERGWQLRGHDLHGFFRTRYGSFRGVIKRATGSSPDYFIESPPKQVLQGPHGPCFRPAAPNLFQIHWKERPDSVDVGILRVEHCILEAMP